jgi:signal peptide peptidase SppA
MKIYFCEHSALEERLRMVGQVINVPENIVADAISVSSDGLGKYGTLKYGINEKTNVGFINVSGFLNNDGPSMFDAYFGRSVTGYGDIIEAIDILSGSGVSGIVFNIDSPGGEVGIVDNVWKKIKGLDVKTEAVIGNMCASGGYYLASACDTIIATNPLAVIGSIGVVVEGIDFSEYLESIGIKFVSVTSDNAPKKRLGFDSDEGIDELKKLVNSAERQFIGRIAEGRNITTEHVKENFGRGGVMHAMDYERNNAEIIDALKVGMIDSVIGYEISITNNGEILMSDKKKVEDSAVAAKGISDGDRKKIEDAATQKANVSNVKRILATKSYSADVVKVGMNVITSEATMDEFYNAIAEFDQKEIASGIDDTANGEEHIPVIDGSIKKSESKPWMICDSESAAANVADFKRR